MITTVRRIHRVDSSRCLVATLGAKTANEVHMRDNEIVRIYVFLICVSLIASVYFMVNAYFVCHHP